MVCLVGGFEQGFVHFGLGVGGQIDHLAQQWQRIFELKVVCDMKPFQMSANYLFVKRFPVMGYP